MATDRQFGERVAQERRRKAAADRRDILKRDVARAVDVSESTVGRWEKGTLPDDPAVLERLAAYFGVTVPWLRYGAAPRELPMEPIERPALETVANPSARDVLGTDADRETKHGSG